MNIGNVRSAPPSRSTRSIEQAVSSASMLSTRSKFSSARRILFRWRWPMRCHGQHGVPLGHAARFSAASCTRFSPTRSSSGAASSIISSGWNFVTPMRRTSSALRPARRAASAISPLILSTFLYSAYQSCILPSLAEAASSTTASPTDIPLVTRNMPPFSVFPNTGAKTTRAPRIM